MRLVRMQKGPAGYTSEPLGPGRGKASGAAARELLLDASCLAFEITKVEQLGATDLAATLDHDRVDDRAESLENTLYAGTVRDLANGEGGIDTAVLLGDNHAFECLDTLAIAFSDPDVDHDGIAGGKIRNVALNLLVTQFFDDVAHGLVIPGRWSCRAEFNCG